MNLDGRIGWGGLNDLAHECFQGGLELFLGDLGSFILAGEATISIEGISCGTQTDNGLVTFVRSADVFTQAYGRTD